jgi:hypothetical protein
MPRVTRSQGILTASVIVVAGLAASAIVATVGPNEAVVCGTGHLPNRLAQAVFDRLGGGQIDGQSAGYCTVPVTSTRLLAAAALLVLFLVAWVVAASRPGRGSRSVAWGRHR